jgi:dimethylargininase
MLALTQTPSLRMDLGVRTYVGREQLDFSRVLDQHAGYCRALAAAGAGVRVLEVNSRFPDGVFLEDTAVILDKLAIVASMGTPARTEETLGVEQVLREYRDVVRLAPPAKLEGGDVLQVGKTLLVGLSQRTNSAGSEALSQVAKPLGYNVIAVPVRGCLHLKTACTALTDGRLLVHPSWLDVSPLRGFPLIPIPPQEPWAANVLLVGQTVVLAATHVRTAELIAKLGFQTRPVEISEFAKAEGGVTCLSLLIP